jgi:phospholipid/cholesterol/gamma-HCH transport system substrate-binding protein
MVMRRYWVEVAVGFFIIVAFLALIALAFQVSGLSSIGDRDYYVLTADFDNIGDLKIRAPVSVSGVKIGDVSNIVLDAQSFRAKVTLHIKKMFNQLPVDTSASILTQGLLGSNYISLTPGFDQKKLENGQQIQITNSAMILENLVGQLMYSLTDDKKGSDDDKNDKPNKK